MSAGSIILGDGVFSLDSTGAYKDIALTRGGGSFVVEREYRQIEADGDYGPVKGRIRKVRSEAKMTLNALSLLPANLAKFYPATLTTDTSTSVDTWKPQKDVSTGDYAKKVKWTGRTRGGRLVEIELENAINLENIDWSLVDKEEVVPEITFTAAYSSSERDVEPWEVKFTTT